MKKILFGTIAAATVVASFSAASAQNRMDRNWSEMRTQQWTMQQSWDSPSRRNAQSYGYNIRFEASDRVK
jgi:Ni/Co efflux regulator RcnB